MILYSDKDEIIKPQQKIILHENIKEKHDRREFMMFSCNYSAKSLLIIF